MTLFRNESFVSHAGLPLSFKIDCDALTDEDIQTLALIIARSHSFSKVVSVPRGGDRLALELNKHLTQHGGTLIVDDVLTTGTSMEAARNKEGGNVQGIVIFARRPCPSWIKPIVQLSDWAGP